MLSIVLILILSLICVADCSQDRKKSFLFVSGWPQSGTSLLQQIFAVSPNISTMVDYCSKYHAKKCINFNHEGQWMLSGDKNLSQYMLPGKMVPIQSMDGQIPGHIQKALLAEWTKYWKLGAEYRVEKSPASMMKMLPMQQLVAPIARRTKFIIILKHPVTLNVATMKYYEWLFHYNVVKLKEAERIPMRNTPEESRRNLRQFLELMLGPRGKIEAKPVSVRGVDRGEGDAGWLDAYDFVHAQLRTGRLDARVLRYEDFRSPFHVCQRIFRFLHEGDEFNLQKAQKQVCERHFGIGSPLMRGSSSRDPVSSFASKTQSQGSRRGRTRPGRQLAAEVAYPTNTHATIQGRRQLRLSHQDYKELRFDPARLIDSVADRLVDFQMIVEDGDVCSVEDLRVLAAINERLLRFGYSLKVTPRGSSGARVKPSVATSGTIPKSSLLSPEAVAVLEAMTDTHNRMGRVPDSIFDEWDLMRL